MKNLQRGVAMIEVLVTAIIMAIGISGIGVLLVQAIQSTQDTSQQTQGMWLVQDFVGRIRANPNGARLGGYETSGVINCAARPAKMCADYWDGSYIPASTCEPAEMAAYDVWITVCGLDTNVYDSPADFLINPEINSSCILEISRGGRNQCVRYNVELTWETRRRQAAASADERNYSQSYSTIVELD